MGHGLIFVYFGSRGSDLLVFNFFRRTLFFLEVPPSALLFPLLYITLQRQLNSEISALFQQKPTNTSISFFHLKTNLGMSEGCLG